MRDWEVISTTRASCFITVSFISFSVFGYPDETLALVVDILHNKTTFLHLAAIHDVIIDKNAPSWILHDLPWRRKITPFINWLKCYQSNEKMLKLPWSVTSIERKLKFALKEKLKKKIYNLSDSSFFFNRGSPKERNFLLFQVIPVRLFFALANRNKINSKFFVFLFWKQNRPQKNVITSHSEYFCSRKVSKQRNL